jgi:hypothetical protein
MTASGNQKNQHQKTMLIFLHGGISDLDMLSNALCQ